MIARMCSLQKKGNLFILTLTGSGEHRLNPTLFDTILFHLSSIRSDPACPRSVLITTAHGKFFCNGADLTLSSSIQQKRDIGIKMRSLVSEMLTLPMPTIAAITGRVAGWGFIFAHAHDYVLMRKDRGFIYMSEMDIGIVIHPWIHALLRAKIRSPAARRRILLMAAKLTAVEAAEIGAIDSAHSDAMATVEAAMTLGEELAKRGWDGYVYGGNRTSIMRDVLDAIANVDAPNTEDGMRTKDNYSEK